MERLSACWGGAAVGPAAEEEREEKCINKTTHWKPMLQTISEEYVDSRRIPKTHIKKRPAKGSAVRPRPRPPPPYCRGKEDNWKSYTKITLPALSPTSFLF